MRTYRKPVTTQDRRFNPESTLSFVVVALALTFLACAGMKRMLMSSLTTTCTTSSLTMPSMGLGTYLIGRDMIQHAIPSALQAGYRRIDCAAVYFNEDAIGDILAQEFNKQTGITRQDLYIVSKLASPYHREEHVELALKKTLTDLRLAYLDLYLIHWPVAFKYVPIDSSARGFENEDIDDSDGGKNIDPNVSVKETWKAMEQLVQKGLVREIGVSNFPVSLLHELLSEAKIKPAVNQVELHPYLQQSKLVRYCQSRGIGVQAYSPLGTPGYKEGNEPNVLEDPILQRIASDHDWTVPQLCLKWALERGTTVVAKSATTSHQQENLSVLKISGNLTDKEMQEIASLDRGYRFFRPEDWWGDMAVFN